MSSRETVDPQGLAIQDLWEEIRVWAEAGEWQTGRLEALGEALPVQGRIVLETAYAAHGDEVMLSVVNNPYLAVPIFQVRLDGNLDSSYVNPVNALTRYRELTTVPKVSFPYR